MHPVNEWELFDLASEAGEAKNLYHDPGLQHTIQGLKKELTPLPRSLQDTGI